MAERFNASDCLNRVFDDDFGLSDSVESDCDEDGIFCYLSRVFSEKFEEFDALEPFQETAGDDEEEDGLDLGSEDDNTDASSPEELE
ncbi:MAG: hypothetical protein A6F71_09670 [Cycloclasticus sp. symbiont of Poecilosclerida sp. M]|nr:MAG: hypothetical protein A6F71_09670 [Cycloclasticus sp. symbiont of Poecilosclerida sp. M]